MRALEPRDAEAPRYLFALSTAYVRECIITPEKTRQIHEAVTTGGTQYGMQSFDQSLYDLMTQNLISYEIALENATNPDDSAEIRFDGPEDRLPLVPLTDRVEDEHVARDR